MGEMTVLMLRYTDNSKVSSHPPPYGINQRRLGNQVGSRSLSTKIEHHKFCHIPLQSYHKISLSKQLSMYMCAFCVCICYVIKLFTLVFYLYTQNVKAYIYMHI